MIDTLAIQLVQQAPDLDPSTVEELRTALRAQGSPLALAISRIVELVAEQLVDPGVALPALAEACATLVESTDPVALAAAHYRIDTLQPMPDLPPPILPDVAVEALRRR